MVPAPDPVNGGVQNATYFPITGRATRYQVPNSTAFNGGEGCSFFSGLIYFSTKGDNRVWRIDTVSDEISILYDFATSSTPELSGVDNVYASSAGDVYVAEDGGNDQIVALTAGGAVKPVVQLLGVAGTEITGPCLDPSGTRLYFSSQRSPGVTFEVTGPFAEAPPAVPGLGAISQAVLIGTFATAAIHRLRGRNPRGA